MRSALAIDVAVAIAFAIVVMLTKAVAIPVLLYDTPGCSPGYCVPVSPRLPIGAIAAGLLLGLFWSVRHGGRRSLWSGIAMGVCAAALAGIVDAARIPFTDPYFTLPYRVYALGLLAIVAAVAVVVGARASARSAVGRGAALAAGAVLLVGALDAARRGDILVSAAALAGIAAGIVVQWRFSRVGPPREALTVAGILLLAFGFRVVFGLQTLARTGPGMAFAVASDDGDSYWPMAQALSTDASQLGPVLAAAAFPPGYTLFLAAILALSGGLLAAVVVAQAALAAVATYWLYRIGRHIAGAATGVLGAVLFALDQNLIQNQSTLTAEAVLIPLMIFAFFALIRYDTDQRVRHLVGAAMATGAAFITRNVAALPLALAAAAWLAARRRSSPRLALRDVGILGVAVLLASAPIGFATARDPAGPRLTTQLASLAWTFDGGPGMTISNQKLVERGIDPFKDPRGSIQRVAEDPGAVIAFYVQAAPQRLATLLFFANPGYSDPLTIVNDVAFRNAFGDTMRLLRLVGLIVGIAWVIRQRAWRRAPIVLAIALFAVLYLAAFTFVFAPYHPFRYRIPIEPYRFIAEAGGLVVVAHAALATLRPATAEPR